MGQRTSQFPERKLSVRKQPEVGRNRCTLEGMGFEKFWWQKPN